MGQLLFRVHLVCTEINIFSTLSVVHPYTPQRWVSRKPFIIQFQHSPWFGHVVVHVMGIKNPFTFDGGLPAAKSRIGRNINKTAPGALRQPSQIIHQAGCPRRNPCHVIHVNFSLQQGVYCSPAVAAPHSPAFKQQSRVKDIVFKPLHFKSPLNPS